MNKEITRKLIEVGGIHKNLFTVESPIYSNPEFGINIFAQGALNGYVAEHDHFNTKETEIIHPFCRGRHYAGLNKSGILRVGDSRIIRSSKNGWFPKHGSLTEKSDGDWISVKIQEEKTKHIVTRKSKKINGIIHKLITNDGSHLELRITEELNKLFGDGTQPLIRLSIPAIENFICGAQYTAYDITNQKTFKPKSIPHCYLSINLS